MRKAMANAPVGDDVYGEDPTINALEAKAAALLGKEAGLFVASGTMGNLTAIMSHAGRGDQAIVGRDSHTYVYEAGGMASLGGIMPHPLPTDGSGRMSLADIEAAVEPDDPHHTTSRLVLVENSYGLRDGYPLPLAYFEDVAAIARRHDLRVHMDGARFFNASVALGLAPAVLAAPVNSVSFCLSKGLGAPVGSLLVGPADFIYRARRARKVVGGGMRQGGILAAAGLIALDEMVDRLADDHVRAQQLAEGLAALPGIVIDPAHIKTNIVFFELAGDVPLSPEAMVAQLWAQMHVRLGTHGARGFRAVTHYWIDDAAVDALLAGLGSILAAA